MSGINVLLALMIIVSFLVAIPLHEFGHALMARWLGDQSVMDRQTLSLRSHIDPVGVLMCVILAFQPVSAFPVGLGWGNPVKPDPWKMRVGPDTGMFIVACAGPLFSLLIGLATAGIAHFAAPFLVGNVFIVRILQLLIVFASVNVALTLFNLIPLYPLDGYQIVYTLLPGKQAKQFEKSSPYGMFVILALFFLLPFLANLAGVGSFPLFHLSYYIWLGAMNLISLVIGPLPLPAALPPDLFSLYLF